ncbi:hypothetical protein [Chryseobacterium sp. c4a]|uniref:hypothetical protein n=1 Tax=Chryseobacterium sp. c4a TaxID=1573582 RepID=UPI00135C98F6|nr:hypothetical protein [Chryseobacterium sp. c4a]
MKTIVSIVLIFCTICFKAQKFPGSISIDNLKTPNSPAFVLLDEAPTNIESPQTMKALALSLVSSFNSSSGFPSNFAVDFTPYFITDTKKTFREYNGFNDKGEYNSFSSAYKNLSVSFAFVKKDSVQNMAIGFKTTLVKLISSDQKRYFTKDLPEIYEKLEQHRQKNFDPITLKNKSEKVYDSLVEKYNKAYSDYMDFKPVFIINIAGAYNHFFDNSMSSSGKFGRLGGWITMNYNTQLVTNKEGVNKNNYLSLYGFGRVLRDEMTFDMESRAYIKDTYTDIGAKIDLQFDKLTIGYEYIRRSGNNSSNDYRSLGSIKYEINTNISIIGGFGKNFQTDKDLVSFLGINWGLNFNNDFETDTPKSTK